jgi:hypothetical protein
MMKSASDDYQKLMDRFLSGEMPAGEFQIAFLEKFKNETTIFGAAVFELLDKVFSDVDAFSADPKLLAKLQAERPQFYLDEQSLRSRIAEASKRLAELQHT